MFTSARRAFTFVEVLIGLTFIAMLVAVAIPNFTEARVSSDVALVKADFQSIMRGVETYKLDRSAYPWMNSGNSLLNPGNGSSSSLPTMERLTTPIAYLSDLPYLDPFEPLYAFNGPTASTLITADTPTLQWTFSQYFYNARNVRDTSAWGQFSDADPYWYYLESAGPDRTHYYTWQMINQWAIDASAFRAISARLIYDPTNGAVSRGSIWKIGGEPQGYGVSMAHVINEANSANVAEWREFE